LHFTPYENVVNGKRLHARANDAILVGHDLESGAPEIDPGELAGIYQVTGYDLVSGVPEIDQGTIFPPISLRIVNLTYKWRATQSTGAFSATIPTFLAYQGHSLDMGTFLIEAPAGFEFTGTVARLRIGRPGEAAHVEWRSDDVPSGVLFGWNEATGELSIDMPSAAGDAVETGRHTYQITIISSSGEPLGPPLVNTFRILPVVGAMA
jgi:hypothetical protein